MLNISIDEYAEELRKSGLVVAQGPFCCLIMKNQLMLATGVA